MDKFDRIQQLHRLFITHKFPLPLAELASRLECSERTVQRDLDFLRYQFSAPVEYCREHNGWWYLPGGNTFELPGLWLTSAEVQSLALVLKLLEDLGEGVLGSELKVMERKLTHLLQARNISRSGFDRHIKVLPVNHRYMPSRTFAAVCGGLSQFAPSCDKSAAGGIGEVRRNIKITMTGFVVAGADNCAQKKIIGMGIYGTDDGPQSNFAFKVRQYLLLGKMPGYAKRWKSALSHRGKTATQYWNMQMTAPT